MVVRHSPASTLFADASTRIAGFGIDPAARRQCSTHSSRLRNSSRSRRRIPSNLSSATVSECRPRRLRPFASTARAASASLRKRGRRRERVVFPGAAPHGSAIEYCETTPKSLASRVSACISSRVAQTDDRSARRKFLRVLPDRYFRDLRVVAWNDNANHVSVLVRCFDDEGLRRFVGMAQECTHQIAASGTLAQFQL